jgi:GNAT superfamily N-acetyltransferase
MRIVPFDEVHAAGCAVLVSAANRRARGEEPLLPSTLEDEARIQERIVGLGSMGLTVVALASGSVVGFAGAFPFDLWERPGAYVPEWGHGAVGPDVVHPLYAAASARWSGAGIVTHALSLFASDRKAEEAWHAVGFGRVLVHGLRAIGDVATPPGVRRAAPEDLDSVLDLDHGLWTHLAAPPTLRIHPESDPDEVSSLLADADRPVWIAEEGGEAVGFSGAAHHHDHAPLAVDDPAVSHVTAAFVRADRRSSGAGRRLVDAALAWGAEQGCDRATVEYESANLEGVRAWEGMGFRPVVHALVRRTV